LLELANLAVELSNSSSDIILKPKDSIYPSRFCGDYSRAKSLLGWQPTHYIKEGIAKYIKELTAEVAKVHHLNMVHVNENFKSYSRISA
jgi:nucleoside-diphosphate-sugar epimerase